MGWLFCGGMTAGVASLLVGVAGCGGNSNGDKEEGKAGHDEKSLFLSGVLARDASSCAEQASHASPLLANGVLDLAFASSYTATLLVGNQFQSARSTPSAPETERVALNLAEVTLTTASGQTLGTYSTVGTGFVDAAADTAAYGGMSVTIVPPGLREAVSLQGKDAIVAVIRVSGEALDGTVMTSSALTFPIQVCTGCLVRYPPEAADPTIGAGSGYRCATVASSSQRNDPPPCSLGQDTPFSCTLCAASLEICRDPTLNPTYQ